MYLVTSAEMQAMDRLAIESFGLPGRVLMENAGREAVRVFLAHFADIGRQGVGVLAGRGNNGGDGSVIARCLAQKGCPVTVFLLANAEKVSGDAAANLKLLSPLGVPVVEMPGEAEFSRQKRKMRAFPVWVDAIFGTGLNSEVKGLFRQVIDFINRLGRPVFAVDIPSGLEADTGRPLGSCIRAQVTATFACAKVGHVVYPGAEYTGRLEVVDIGIPLQIAERVGPRQRLLTRETVRSYLPERAPDTHKGRTGHLLVVAGSPGKSGAAAMAAVAAMRVGAGLVTVGVPEGLNAVMETLTLEAMTAPLPETSDGLLGAASREAILALAEGKSCLVIGPGLGRGEETRELVLELVRRARIPMVIDADGLNHLCGRLELLKGLPTPAVLTPHPGEMARLIESDAAAVQRNRVQCARDLAVSANAHIVLKGARTVVAHPDGTVWVNPTGNPGMASGGMGDVLTGAVAGLICQGLLTATAARAAVYLHGAAADRLARTTGPWGYLAGDVAKALPGEIAALIGAPG
jgi:NAD(P)H-hydrate epimerase